MVVCNVCRGPCREPGGLGRQAEAWAKRGQTASRGVGLWWALAVSVALCGCSRTEVDEVRGCWDDSECAQPAAGARVCRQGGCRQACEGGYWVGQPVLVRGASGVRAAKVAQCMPLAAMQDAGAADAAATKEAASLASSRAERQASTARGTYRLRRGYVWVTYETGIEEQVAQARLRTVSSGSM